MDDASEGHQSDAASRNAPRQRGGFRRARNARVLAFKVLYEVDIARHSAADVFDRQVIEARTPADESDLARVIVRGVLSTRPGLDALIGQYAPSWPIEQLSAVERNILRIALYELLHERERVPAPVAINEAVELAKMFGGDAASGFVNGVLGQVARAELAAPGVDETESLGGDS